MPPPLPCREHPSRVVVLKRRRSPWLREGMAPALERYPMVARERPVRKVCPAPVPSGSLSSSPAPRLDVQKKTRPNRRVADLQKEIEAGPKAHRRKSLLPQTPEEVGGMGWQDRSPPFVVQVFLAPAPKSGYKRPSRVSRSRWPSTPTSRCAGQWSFTV